GAAGAQERDGRPAVARDDRAIGPEALAERCKLLGARRRVEAPGECVALSYAEVVDGPDVEAAQLEHQVHLGRPPADAPDGDERGDQLVIAAAQGSRQDE